MHTQRHLLHNHHRHIHAHTHTTHFILSWVTHSVLTLTNMSRTYCIVVFLQLLCFTGKLELYLNLNSIYCQKKKKSQTLIYNSPVCHDFASVLTWGAFESGIVGGKESKPHSRPYMASLQISQRHSCGGILIREDFVLTAAHCKEWVYDSSLHGPHPKMLFISAVYLLLLHFCSQFDLLNAYSIAVDW